MKKFILGFLLVSGFAVAQMPMGRGFGMGQEVSAIITLIEQSGQANAAAMAGNIPAAEAGLQRVFQELSQLIGQARMNPVLQPILGQLIETQSRLGDLRIPSSQRAGMTIDSLTCSLTDLIMATSSLGGITGALNGVGLQVSIAHRLSQQNLMAVGAKLTQSSLRLLMQIVPCPVSGPFIDTAKQALMTAERQFNDPSLGGGSREAAVCQSLGVAEQAMRNATTQLARGPAVAVPMGQGGYPQQQGGMPMPYQNGGGYQQRGYPNQGGGYNQGNYPQQQGGYPQYPQQQQQGGGYYQGNGQYPQQQQQGGYNQGNYNQGGMNYGGGRRY